MLRATQSIEYQGIERRLPYLFLQTLNVLLPALTRLPGSLPVLSQPPLHLVHVACETKLSDGSARGCRSSHHSLQISSLWILQTA